MAADRMVVAKLPPISGNHGNYAANLSPRSTRRYEGLNGPSYTLNKSNYNLPPPAVLKPYQDTKAGGLDTWPAHATGPAISMTSVQLTRDKQLCVVDEEAQGKTPMVPKPKFLEQLETFLKKELRNLGATEVGPSELRLQAHREVFEYLIEDFKTYRPILSSIKNEYEMMLAHYRDQIRQLEPLKQMLVTVSEQCDQKIMLLRDQEKQEIADLKQEMQRLYKRIDGLHQEKNDLETQVEKLQEELAAEYLRYRDECDARKMLVADINDLRYQQEDIMVSKQNIAELEEEQDDPITLRIALRKAREDETAATKRLHEMIANYGDVIPRRDFETLQKQFQELETKADTTQDDFHKLKDEHDTLLDVNKQIVQQRDEYYVECENLRRSATPRPDWGRCADHVAGGIMRWQELSEAKTSDQLVGVLLGEISGGAGADAGGAEFFDGQGTGPEVPAYLCYEGKVRNRRLGKRDCALLIRDIWREKAAHDAEKSEGVRDKLSDFLHTYLQRRFSIEQMVVEWGYNLHDACQRYSHDERIGLFWRILTGEADEELYHDQLQTIARLLNHLTKLDVDQGNQGSLSKEDFMAALREYFPSHDDDSIATLTKHAETELEAKDLEVLEYKTLFMEDDEGKTGVFLDEVKAQHKAVRMKFVDQITSELHTVADNNAVHPDDLRKALTMADLNIENTSLDHYLCWAFKVDSKDKLDTVEPQEQSVVIVRLQNGNLKRSTGVLN